MPLIFFKGALLVRALLTPLCVSVDLDTSFYKFYWNY